MSFAASPPSDIDAVIDLARGAPIEMAADALIRVAALDQVPKKRRIELLDQSFAMAASAPQPYKRRGAFPHPNGPAAFLNRVYQQDLDANSLQLRAVEGLLPLDPVRARQRFQDMVPLQLPPLTCEDFLVYDVDRFYTVLERVAVDTFSPKEIRDGEPGKFLARYLARTASAVEVAPAARLLAGAPLTDPEFQSLVTAFAGTLGRISGDDRSFTYAAAPTAAALQALADQARHRETSPVVLLQAYRQFLVSNLSGARCADSEPLDPAVLFNDKVQPPVQPISPDEVKASKVEGKAKGADWCEDPECLAVREKYHALMIREDGQVYQPRERESTQWQARVRDFLGVLVSWTQSSGATAAEHYREKIGFYNDVFAMVPNGATREFVLRGLVNFLTQSRLPPENRQEWLLAISQLAGRVALDPLGLGRLADDLRGANDPAIALALALEAIAPRPASQIMTLL